MIYEIYPSPGSSKNNRSSLARGLISGHRDAERFTRLLDRGWRLPVAFDAFDQMVERERRGRAERFSGFPLKDPARGACREHRSAGHAQSIIDNFPSRADYFQPEDAVLFGRRAGQARRV